MKYNNRWAFLLCYLFLFPIVLLADPVDVETARERAEAWLNARSSRGIMAEDIHLDYRSSAGYLFSNRSHFALMAADDDLPEVLGYGEKNGDVLPPAFLNLVQAQKYPHFVKRQKYEPVAPLLTFVRHQSAPYNNCCPLYKNGAGVVTPYHCLVGCVATALEEVISYYRRTVVLQDTLHGWETPQYVIEDVLPGTNVDCRLIRDNYDVDDYTQQEADAVARLSFYCGVAAHMRWGIDASGANVHNLVEPMQRAFGYPYVHFFDSYDYAPADWLTIMRNELYGGRPVLYAGFNMWMNGHAFVVDGLDEDGLFHINWGMEGCYDGFFRLDVLNYCEPPQHETPEGREAAFFCNHQALLLCPDAVEQHYPDTLARTGREIVIDSITVDRTAETGKHTPLTVYFRNATDQPLTTPFEFFTNLPTDTALFKQADYVALTGTILAPHERRVMRIHAAFDKAGQRMLRVSPDGEIVVYEMPVSISEGTEPQLTFHEPEVTFPETDRAFVRLHVDNAEAGGFCGQELLYEIKEGDPDSQLDPVRHSRHLYIEPGEEVCDTVSFRYLKPGQMYTLRIRSPWKVKAMKTFTMPMPSGITKQPVVTDACNKGWYLLDGRSISRPKTKGIYIRREGNQTKKIYIK